MPEFATPRHASIRSTELLLFAASQLVFPARVRAGLPGNQLEAGLYLGTSFCSVLRVPMKHPCYQLHSALDGGTGKKHVHVVNSRLPLRSR